jgi:cell division transport system permease protein
VSRFGMNPWLRAWGRRQLYSFFSSLGTLLNHRIGTIMTVLVLGIAMVLPLGLYVAMTNLHGIDLQAEEWGAITVFMDPAATESDVMEFMQVVEARTDATATAITPQQGMEEFSQASGFGSALEVLESNPLPWVLLVRPQAENEQNLPGVVQNLGIWLESAEVVQSVQLDYKWLQRLAGLLALGNAIVSILTFMFCLAVVVVIANTIRMDVANRSDEIEVLSLVGAGNGFIRQPFLYSGFWYGLMGAGLALVLLNLSLGYLQNPLESLLDAYGNAFTMHGLGFSKSLLVLISGGLLGFLGAWISVERYLRVLRRGGLLRKI